MFTSQARQRNERDAYSPSLQPDDPWIGIIHRGCRQRAVLPNLLPCPEEKRVVGMPRSVHRDISSKVARQGARDVG